MKEFLVALFCVSAALVAVPVEAATLYIDPADTEIHPGNTIALGVRIDTDEGECINAIDGVITYPENIAPVDISLGNSIFPVWIEQPKIDKKNRRITFAGGIPNGYCGRISGDPRLTNIILELIFQAPGFQIGVGDRDPLAQIEFTNETKVLLNDGAGTPARLTTLPSQVYVYTQPNGSNIDEWKARITDDKTPPNEFSISLNSDKSIFASRYFIVFNTTDKQSGIDHYEVIEEPIDQFKLFKWGGVDAPWIEARSPYKLKDQSLNSIIRVRAFDKAGNQYVATYIPEESVRGMSQREIVTRVLWVSGVIVLITVMLSVWFYRRRVRKLRLLSEDSLISPEEEPPQQYD